MDDKLFNRNRLVEANQPFVISIARQYQGQGLHIDDLISEGNIGMIKAAEKYDPARGVPFAPFAVVYIRRQIEKALDKESAGQRVETRHDGITRSVDAPLGTKSNMNLLSVLIDGNAPMADERIYNASVERAVEYALQSLEGRECQVVNAYFGIGQDSLTMAEIAEDMGLKRERVRQIRDRAIRRMKQAYNHRLGKELMG